MNTNKIKNYHWQNRSANYSTHGSRTGRNLLGWEEDEIMTPEQERDCLVARIKQIDNELTSLPKKDLKRKDLGKLKFEIQAAITAIRPKMKCKGIEAYVMDVLRDELMPYEWDLLMQKAKARHAADIEKSSMQDSN